MYEMTHFVNRRRRMSTVILRNPTGTYSLAGSMPIDLTEEGRWGRVSLTWATEADAIAALLAIGCDTFQLSDCSWYQGRQPTA
jgi:hypothetical protein